LIACGKGGEVSQGIYLQAITSAWSGFRQPPGIRGVCRAF
jgi:hypothetical protein